jgi:uncharacterized cysteine cluster protein YcgN (CxxCxxCC family)
MSLTGNNDSFFLGDVSLDELSKEEWESLCDGCGLCCVYKIEDEDTGEIIYTEIACRLLDTENCRCSDYENRHSLVPSCAELSPRHPEYFRWLPETCAYRRLYEGRPLPEWHHLLTGDRESVHRAGASIKGKCISETVLSATEEGRAILEELT